MTGLPLAHVGGIPFEETLGSLGPALLLAAGAASAKLSARRRHLRTRPPSSPELQRLAVVDAGDIEAVRDFMFQGRLVQWNTTSIHATYSLDEALVSVNELDAIF